MEKHTVNLVEFSAVLRQFFTKHIMHLTYDKNHVWTAQDYKHKTIFLECVDRIQKLGDDIIRTNDDLYTFVIFAKKLKAQDEEMARNEFIALQQAFCAACATQTVEL